MSQTTTTTTGKTRKQIRAHPHFHSSRIGTIVAAHINEYLALGRTTDFQSRYQRHGKDQESERISPFHRSMVNPPLSANHSAPPLLYSSVSNLRFYHDSIGTRRRLHSSSTRTTMPSTIVHFEITRAEYKTRLITFPMDGLPSHANGHPLVRRMGGKSTSADPMDDTTAMSTLRELFLYHPKLQTSLTTIPMPRDSQSFNIARGTFFLTTPVWMDGRIHPQHSPILEVVPSIEVRVSECTDTSANRRNRDRRVVQTPWAPSVQMATSRSRWPAQKDTQHWSVIYATPSWAQIASGKIKASSLSEPSNQISNNPPQSKQPSMVAAAAAAAAAIPSTHVHANGSGWDTISAQQPSSRHETRLEQRSDTFETKRQAITQSFPNMLESVVAKIAQLVTAIQSKVP